MKRKTIMLREKKITDFFLICQDVFKNYYLINIINSVR